MKAAGLQSPVRADVSRRADVVSGELPPEPEETQ
jgi:hypothetical protein